MNTAVKFFQVQPRRRHDSPTMKLWACVVDGKIIAYTDEPETLAADLPRVNELAYVSHPVKNIRYHELLNYRPSLRGLEGLVCSR
jgi:hypothetical protein